ncbi:GNAT family N-acetyltransferase [Candidatus Enterococcus clewellii]|uniref:N-acetyltransferase domain-containing protein n=1 Tax=Candidatus Enterococcus clewellii TaxID=1834193 RepID=A0A242KBT2_9ENTE|nr:GNAT family N-acetyltransferase [Enterococcus sp. 9E7_DIV0242]OTP18529.1 hypothetical protein A5888_000343 [Enterococcus sp. 9E7_DIV0242]
MVQIRRSTKNNLVQLVRMRRLFFEENYSFTEEESTTFEEKTAHYLAERLDNTLISWHAEQGDDMVAVAFLEIAERLPHPARKYGRTGTILNVYTKKSFRSQGIASQLVQQLIKEAEELQLDKVDLMATKLGYPVYKKLGFCEFTFPDKMMERKLD